MTNCPNCGAPIHGSICEYCGTEFGLLKNIAPGTLYKCNPTLYKRCPKTHCYLNGGECRSTRYPEFALVNKMGALLTANEMRDLFL